jgi:hypothetical protein
LQSIVPYVLIIKDLYGIAKKTEEKTEIVAKNNKKPVISSKSVAIVSVITVVCYAIALVVGLLSVNYNGLTAAQSRFSGADGIYNNAFVYEYKNLNGKEEKSILLKDLDLYSHMKNDMGGFGWNADKQAFTVSDETSTTLLPTKSDIFVPYYKNKTSKLFKFGTDENGNAVRLGEKSAMTITFKIKNSGDKISKVRLVPNVSSLTTTEGATESKYVEYDVNGSEITLTVPAGYGSDLGVEVFATASQQHIPAIEIEVQVRQIYRVGTLDKMGELSSVYVNNEVISSLSSKYSSSDIIDNVYFVFDYTYVGSTSIPTVK